MHSNILVELKKIVLLSFVFLLLLTAVVIRFVRPVVAEETIYIRPDGTVEGKDKIQRDGNIYTFTDNIFNQSIIVERDNIVVDGVGYILQGIGNGTGIDLSYRSNVTIKNTKIKAFDIGMYLWRSSNNTISGNNITNTKWGIKLNWNSDSNTIFENNLSTNMVAIYIFDSHCNIISRNTLSNNSGCICLEICQHNTISDNTITNNNYGIMLGYHSYGNSVFGNYIATNGDSGIRLSHSHHNTIHMNNITNHSNGIWLKESFSNKFYHNNFIDNTQQVCDETPDDPIEFPSINVWDDGVGKGNYWSDYEDRYPNATELDGSGIWNTPYFIGENNQDNYPLVPEFPTLISILLILIGLTIAIAIYKRRLLKTPKDG